MYNVKGPSKIVAKTTRRGISQNMDNMRDYTRTKSIDNETNESAPLPKPVFHNKKSNSHYHQHYSTRIQEAISPQHEEMINFINESWNNVCSEMSQSPEKVCTKNDHLVYYEDEPICLEDFKPFDLESWWGKRLYACITGGLNNNNNNAISNKN